MAPGCAPWLRRLCLEPWCRPRIIGRSRCSYCKRRVLDHFEVGIECNSFNFILELDLEVELEVEHSGTRRVKTSCSCPSAEAVPLNMRRLERQLSLKTSLLDFSDSELPAADLVVAADLLYLRSTSQALARSCVAALRSGASVLVGDTGRPGRKAFLEALEPIRCHFEELQGWQLALPRHGKTVKEVMEERQG